MIELNKGVAPSSIKSGMEIFGESRNMLPIDRFIERPKGEKAGKPKGQQGKFAGREGFKPRGG